MQRIWNILALPILAHCSAIDAGPTITWEAAQEAMTTREAILIDVRIPSEFDGSIPGAVAIPYARSGRGGDDDAFTMEVEMASSGRRVILVCLYGVRSKWARDALVRRGIESVSIHGGTRQRPVPSGLRLDDYPAR